MHEIEASDAYNVMGRARIAQVDAPADLESLDERVASDLPLTLFRDRYARGGYRWTRAVNQTLGAYLSKLALRLGLRPVHLSLLNIALGIGASAWVVLLRPGSPVLAAVVGAAGWTVAYSLDCADGQVARATETTSPGGAILDLLGDYLVQVTVIFTMLQFATPALDHTWLAAFSVFVTGGWLISPYYSGILGTGDGRPRLELSSLRGIVAQARDYGLHVVVLPFSALAGPVAVVVVLSLIALLNFIALFLGIGSNSRKGF